MKAMIMEPFIIRGYFMEKDFKSLDELSENTDGAYKELGDELKKD